MFFLGVPVILDALRCSFCNGPLSIPPIMLTNNVTGQYKCGRCTKVETDFFLRESLYETLAQFNKFPCGYPNCTERVGWNEPMKEHEMRCQHKTIICPELKCQSFIKIIDIENHLHSHQYDDLCNYKFEINPNETENGYVRCIKKGNLIYIVYVHLYKYPDITRMSSDSSSTKMTKKVYDKIYFTVLSLVPTTMKYNLIFTSQQSSKEIKIFGEKIDNYDDRLHCSKCIFVNRICQVDYHKMINYSFDNIRTTLIDKDELNRRLNACQPVTIELEFIQEEEEFIIN